MAIRYNEFVKRPNQETEYTDDYINELIKCRDDILYFTRNYVKIVTLDRGEVLFDPYEYQIEALEVLKKNRFFIGLWSRQSGKSSIFANYCLWYAIFNSDKNIGIVSNKESSAKRILDNIKRMYELLPIWMKPGVTEYAKTSITFDNRTKIIISATTADAFRGWPMNMLLMDEFAFVPKNNAEEFWASNYPTISSSQESRIVIISCVTDNTYVYSDKGIKQIKDFIIENKDGGYRIKDYNILGKDKLNSGNLFVNSGETETRIIKTTNSILEGSLNHKLWACKNGKYDWFKMSELEEGDYISLQYGKNIWGSNDTINFKSKKRKNKQGITLEVDKITEDWAYLFGLYIAEGYADKYRLNISCGDDISFIYDKLGIKYTCNDEMHYISSCLSLIDLLKHVGFDINKKANEKEIPKKLLEMSKENISSMLCGLFDGDGWSRQDKGFVGIGLSSKKLIEQIRMLLMNFGILTDYREVESKPTKKVKVKSMQYRLQCDKNSSRKFYELIGFNLERKQNNFNVLNEFKEAKNCDLIPYSKDFLMGVKSLNTNSKFGIIKDIEKKMNTHIYNRAPNGHFSRALMLRMKNVLNEINNIKVKEFFDNNISENIKWCSITEIKKSRNKVYDFSLPDIQNDPWCHSVVYNGYIGHQTPNGMFNIFHRLYTGAVLSQKDKNKGNNFIPQKVSWEKVPGRDKEWAKEQIKNLGIQAFNQEFAVKFLGSSNTVINAEVLRTLLNSDKEPVFFDLNDRLRVWEKPIDGAQYILGCLPPDERVITDSGLKLMKDVISSDKLIDKNGKYTSIKNIQLYKDIEDKIYDVSVYGTYRSTKFTSEHPLYVSKNPQLKRKHGESRYRNFKFDFEKVKNITTDDWIRYPNIYKNKKLSEEELKNKINQYSIITRKDFIINENIILDKNFWWLVGCWLGDGWIQNYKNSYTIHTCHNIKTEYHYAEKIQKLFKKYNRSTVIFDKGSCVNTISSSKQLYKFLEDNFGKYAHGKYISEWVKYIPNKYKLQLIKGYIDSDGCLYENNKSKNSTFNMVSVSLELLEGIQDILYSLGYISNLQKKNNNKIFKNQIKSRKKYSLTLSNYDSNLLAPLIGYKCKYISKRNRNKRYCYFSDDQKYIYFKIKKIEKTQYKGDVYNFETDSHEFLCRNITTHNCDPSKGTGEHYSTIQIFKVSSKVPVDIEQVAVFEDNLTDVYEFSNIIHRLSIYYNNAYILCENNGEGSAVISQLWWHFENENLVNSGTKTVNLGIRSNRNTKPKAVLLMKKLIEDGSVTLYDRETIEQLGSFIEDEGKFYGKDKDDDLIDAIFWATWIFEMNVMSDEWKFKDGKMEQDDSWGILTDIEDTIDDWSWLNNSKLFDR